MKIRVEVAALKDILKTNRAQHETDYNEAVEKYFKAVGEEVEKMAKRIEKGKKPARCLKSLEPVQYLAEYDRAIRMLELHQDTSIILDETQYTQFVEDEWHWKRNFVSNTLSYK